MKLSGDVKKESLLMHLPLSKVARYLASSMNSKCWYLIFHITTSCNQKCRMCFNRGMDIEHDNILKIEEIERIAPYFDQLFQLTLSGGEPILRNDLSDIIRVFNKKKPIPRITIPSNGSMPSRLMQMVQRIADENPKSNINVALSLDGIGELHDDIRGSKGAFVKFIESMNLIANLAKEFKNVTLVVASTISYFNQEHVDEILDFIGQQSNPQIFGMMLTRGMTREKDAVIVNVERFITTLERLRQIQKPYANRLNWAWTEIYHRNRIETIRNGHMIDPCQAGSKLLILTHDGYLWPCEILQWGHSNFSTLEGGLCFGNVREVNFDVNILLHSYQASKIRRYIRERNCWCTFECALLNNFALNPLNYLKTLNLIVMQYLKGNLYHA